jgi:TPP-dependent pyruvate/acetoin dehydrogenase alpha subunit
VRSATLLAAPPNAVALDAYARMRLIRRVEERLLGLFADGLVAGTVHTCLGQEACAVGVVGALDPARDVVWSNHRGHGHYLAYTDDVDGLLGEVLGRVTGVSGGVGGSQHLHRGGFYSNGVLGGTAPCAAGCALAEQAAGRDGVTVVFHGDGALAEGAVTETLNLAALWALPLLVVVEANGWAQSTPTAWEHAGDVADRARPFGIPTEVVDGNDVLAVRAAADAAVAAIRAGQGPRYLVLRTFRLGPHSKGDDLRPAEEVAAGWAADPLPRLAATLSPEAVADIDAAVERRVTAAVEAALAAPVPDPATFLATRSW